MRSNVPEPDHSAFGLFVITIGLALLVFVLGVVFVKYAFAHGPAEWIQRGGYKNAAGELCCGERDCFEIDARDIQETPQGFYIKTIKEFVPHSEATPSPDGRYWRCAWSGKRRCFFAPPGQS